MKIHILAIAGAMTSALAVALKKNGHEVTGSDQDKIYPPFSTILESNQIPLNLTFTDADLVIVGSGFKSFSRCVDEYNLAISQKIDTISATQYLAKNLIKPESILVAGAYGKTTITALLAHIITPASYFIGGQTVDGQDSLVFSDSPFSIVEADESINGLDTQAKFLYYPVKYLILTSANWEHKESYPTPQANFEAFKSLVANIPSDGVLVYNSQDPTITPLLPFCHAKTIPYANQQFDTKLIGQHNQQNIAATFSLCQFLKLDDSQILSRISSFSGVKRRLETVAIKNNIHIIDDFAQSSVRTLSAIQAIKFTYPQSRVLVYFEPHARFLQDKRSLTDFDQIANLVDKFILGKIAYSSQKESRVELKDWAEQIGDKLVYLPLSSQIVDYFKENLKEHDVLVHFSSGGLEGLNTLKTVYNSI